MKKKWNMRTWMNKISSFSLLASLAGSASAGDEVYIYPVPRNLSSGQGTLVVTGGNLAAPPLLSSVVIDKAKELFRFYADVTLTEGIGTPQMSFVQNSRLHDQGYSLKISAVGIEVSYKDDAGAFYALATLKQLLFQHGAKLPYLTITDDYPDFPNRGFMWDISRNKIPTVDTIKRVIRLMADLKYNQLQLYIEGYPFAYDSYPDVWKYDTPLTPAELQEINLYCTKHFIEFVPNQNSYGHMNKWLKLPQFDEIKEVPGMAGATTIALTNPKTINFLKNLYSDLLPNFTSQYFNIGGDETYEVGTGQSKAEYPDLSKEEIYLEGLKTLYGLLKEENKTMMFWADMIVKYADSNPSIVRAAKEAMPDAIPINWGYEFNYDFGKSTATLKNAGFEYYVSPGTSTWKSFIGRTSNMTANLENAARWGIQNGAIGYLLTVWGDEGHPQHLVWDYPALAYSAGLSWCYDRNKKELTDYNKYVSRFILQDEGETLSEQLSALADYGAITPRSWNQSWIHSVFSERDGQTKNLKEFIEFQQGESEIEKVAAALSQAVKISKLAEDFLLYLDGVAMKSEESSIFRGELKNGADMLKAASEYTAMRLRIFSGATTPNQENEGIAKHYNQYKATLADFQKSWLIRNKYSDLDDTMSLLSRPMLHYRSIAGGMSSILHDNGNHVLITPDTLGIHLASSAFIPGWVWSLSGSGEPVITIAYGGGSTARIRGLLAEKVISVSDNVAGVTGRVFCFDPVAAVKNSFYEIWRGDGQTKQLPRVGWPVLFEKNGEYEITLKVKFKNETPLRGNVNFSMTAAKEGGPTVLPPINTVYSEPDSHGWRTVSQRYAVTDNITAASFYITVPDSVSDILYINGLFMKSL